MMTTAHASSPRQLDLTIDSHPRGLAEVRRKIEALCAACGAPREACDAVGLCVNEVLANVMRHAYQGKTDRPIVIHTRCIEHEVEVTIRDWGNGIDPADLPAREHDPLTPGGLGLICLRQLMDHTSFQRQPDGMLTVMRKKY